LPFHLVEEEVEQEIAPKAPKPPKRKTVRIESQSEVKRIDVMESLRKVSNLKKNYKKVNKEREVTNEDSKVLCDTL